MINRLIVKSQSILSSSFRIIALVIAIVLIISFVRNTIKVNSAASRLNEAKDRLEETKEKQQDLLAELEYVQSGYYEEKQIRDKLGLSQDSELVIVLPDQESLRRLSPRLRREEENTLPEPNWKRWYSTFFQN